MAAIEKISYFRGRRDEVPNQELAMELAREKDAAGIHEIADNLWNKNKSISSDCLKVLYEIGYIEPQLIADYVDDFIKLLKSKENRMVWGAMIALSTIADLRANEIGDYIDEVIETVAAGSVITVVSGVKTLAKTAAENADCRPKVMPVLYLQLKNCIPRDLPTHAESILPAVDENNRDEVLSILQVREHELTPTQLGRLNRVIKRIKV